MNKVLLAHAASGKPGSEGGFLIRTRLHGQGGSKRQWGLLHKGHLERCLLLAPGTFDGRKMDGLGAQEEMTLVTAHAFTHVCRQMRTKKQPEQFRHRKR